MSALGAAAVNSAEPEPDKAGSGVGALVRAEQFVSVKRSLTVSIPVNVVVGMVGLVVAAHSGLVTEGLVWFAASTAANVLRLAICLSPFPRSARVGDARRSKAVERRLTWSVVAAFASGCVWATQPVLSAWHTTPQTLFYLVSTCGIAAGAITHGTTFARIPIAFITPPLIATAVCLFRVGGFDQNCLGGIVFVYLAALARSAVKSEAIFCDGSRSKHVASAMTQSLAEANGRAFEIAEQMARRAARDPLTDLLNRAGFMDDVERLRGEGDGVFGVMLLDLDGFKALNDEYGHKAGDGVLVEVARRLKAVMPPDAVVARLGGDEFAAFLRVGPGAPSPTLLADRVIASVAKPFPDLDAGKLGISIGIYALKGVPIDKMLTCADVALYEAKSAGRNRAYAFDDTLRVRQEMRRDIERELPRALEERTLATWFQPIFGGGGQELASFEALIRWRHPVHGWVSPPDLIAAAASGGLADALLRFILDEACAMLTRLEEMGLGHVQVAVNVSPREMAQLPVDEIVLSRLAALGIAPDRLEIEFTEETAMDVVAVRHKLAALETGGIRLAVDDFGVGFSSLASLRHLRPDRVKIDRTFVTGIARSAEDRTLVGAILGLGRSLGFDVVAEGVETAEDLLTLRAAGCQYMQGYFFGRPMPAEGVLAWLRKPGSGSIAA